MEISELQHPDSVWTWKSGRTGKASLWLPYFDRVECVSSLRRVKDCYRFYYKGGQIITSLSKVDFIMLYGASGYLPIEFLDKLSTYRIPLMIHRRNMPSPYLFFPDQGADAIDVLSQQLLVRSNAIKSTYLARTLIRERFRAMAPRIQISDSTYKQLNQCRSINAVRQLEAEITARYWKAFFAQLNLEGEITRRDKTHPVNQAMNAASHFLSGILLRWALFHKLSPAHGYLHVQTSYPSLVFDLIEPYRYLIEQALQAVYPKGGLSESTWLTGATINELKRSLGETIYVPATRQNVRRKNLLHGIVLGLRAYLVGDMKRFVVPTEGQKMGGRPIKVSFKMPGGVKTQEI